ncbi:MAG: DUF3098 domain-containing protein [Rikenellaceae bacterium]|nr:DUF3098 domain-containing protein [Rikenellaceae bacterium]
MKKQASAKNKPSADGRMPLTTTNYIMMLAGFAVIVLGLILMAGGRSESGEVFNYGMFSFRRITLAPIVVLAGFIFEIYAIMRRPKVKK